jgi:hypothetical protein
MFYIFSLFLFPVPTLRSTLLCFSCALFAARFRLTILSSIALFFYERYIHTNQHIPTLYISSAIYIFCWLLSRSFVSEARVLYHARSSHSFSFIFISIPSHSASTYPRTHACIASHLLHPLIHSHSHALTLIHPHPPIHSFIQLNSTHWSHSHSLTHSCCIPPHLPTYRTHSFTRIVDGPARAPSFLSFLSVSLMYICNIYTFFLVFMLRSTLNEE